MRLLLDTHTVLWFLSANDRLGDAATALVTNPENDVFVSVATLWEITVKRRIGKLDADVVAVSDAMASSGLTLLELKPGHLATLQRLPIFPDHRDPFDHLLIAQSLSERLTFMSNDQHAPRYGVDLVRCS
jgi:PIN domain nuclease of toxin-antitoxin system